MNSFGMGVGVGMALALVLFCIVLKLKEWIYITKDCKGRYVPWICGFCPKLRVCRFLKGGAR